MARRQGQTRPQGGRAGRGALPEPAPGAGDRSGVPGQRLLRRPRRGAGQVRDGAQGQGRTAPRSPRPPRRSGTPGPPTTPAAAALEPSGLEGLVPARPGPRGASKLTGEILAWAEQQLAADPGAAPGAAGRPDRGLLRRARAPPLGRASAGPPPGAPLQKPLTCPPARRGRRTTRPCPCSPSPGHAAAEPGARPDAGQDTRPRRRAGRPLRATAPCRPARARRGVPARARRADRQAASPPGGTPWPAWPPPAASARHQHRRPPGTRPAPASRLPAPVAAELISVLAAVALAGTITGPPP